MYVAASSVLSKGKVKKAMSEFQELISELPQIGKVEWIGLRPARREPPIVVEKVETDVDQGLIGERFDGGKEKKRQVTLIQKEHIDAVGNILQIDTIDPGLLRRNIVISGINLQALKQRNFQIGDAVFYGTGNCPPCSRMEENLGKGGYNAMLGHGGITAYVVTGGTIKIGDKVQSPMQTSESQLAPVESES